MTTRTSGINPFAMFAVFVILLGMLAVAAADNTYSNAGYGYSDQSVVLPSTPADASMNHYYSMKAYR